MLISKKNKIVCLIVCYIWLFASSKQLLAQRVVPINNKSTTLFNMSISNTEGGQHHFATFKGKKIWLIVLPDSLKKKDSSLLLRIDSIASTFLVTVQTIVIPIQDGKGFISDGGASFAKHYETMRKHHVLFSSPMAIKKAKPTSQQYDILEWLTSADLNGHFTKKIDSRGAMYLIDAEGELKGAFDINNIWNLGLLQMIFQ